VAESVCRVEAYNLMFCIMMLIVLGGCPSSTTGESEWHYRANGLHRQPVSHQLLVCTVHLLFRVAWNTVALLKQHFNKSDFFLQSSTIKASVFVQAWPYHIGM